MNGGIKALTLAVCSIGGSALAQQGPASPPDDLDVTMQIIEDPNAMLPDQVVRRIELPSLDAQRRGREADHNRPEAAADAEAGQQHGVETAREARELGREFGQDMAEQAREMAEDAAQDRENFGRTRAEEARPDPPEDPAPPKL